MNTNGKVEAFYSKDGPFQEELNILRGLARQTGAVETLKWGSPVYMAGGKNVFGIMGFKHHFGLWFFNGVYLKDTYRVLGAGQEGTKAMRHWKFHSKADIDTKGVLEYMKEAIANQKKGIEHKPERKKKLTVPPILQKALSEDSALGDAFKSLSPFKQREYCEHISGAKQEKTRYSRLEKCLPLIRMGVSLNDKYRQ